MDTTLSPTTAESTLRWFHPTPARLLVALLAVEGSLLLSQHWMPKGYAVLIAIAAVGMTMVLMLIWWLTALCFHWRFQFSLRSLLVATVVVAIPFSWLAVEMKRAREQGQVVEEIQRLGGRTYYDYEDQPGATPVPPGLIWLQTLLHEEFFADVVRVDFGNTQITDSSLESLKTLTKLYGLWLDSTKVTDEGLTNIEALTQLKVLSLKSTKVTDNGLEHFKALTQLQTLSLTATKVTDNGLEHLKALTQLEWLQLDNTTVTDRGLVSLEALTQLQTLHLFGTEVTDKGVKELKKALPNCYIGP